MRRLLMFLLCVLIALPGFLFHPPATAQPPDPFPRTITDATGHAVTIAARPRTIGVWGSVPGLAGLVPSSALVPLDPALPTDWTRFDLLLTPTMYAAAYPDARAAAERAGVPVFQVALVNSLEAWAAHISALGQITGTESAATQWLSDLDALRARHAAQWARCGATCDPVSVLVLTPEFYTFGAPTVLTDLITLAGGINVAAEAGYADFRQVDDPSLLALAPDVILLTPAWDTAPIAAFRAVPLYANIPAIRTGRIVRWPVDLTQPDDPAALLRVLAWGLHPAALLPGW